MYANNKAIILIISIIIILFSTSCEPCSNESDLYKEIPASIKDFLPARTVTRFTMISTDSIQETYLLQRYEDTIYTTEPDRCGHIFKWDMANILYTSSLSNNHNFEYRLDAVNNIVFQLGINYKQWASWDFEEGKETRSGYDSNDYPEAYKITFIDDYTLNGETYQKVMKAEFRTEELVEDWQIEEVIIAAKEGPIWYRLKNGVDFFRK